MKLGKEGSFFTSWPEYLFIVLLVIGVLLSVSVKNKFLMLLIVFLCGFITGNLVFVHRKKLKFPIAIVLAGFIIGFVIGSRALKIGWLSIVLVFALGNAASYFLNREGILPRHRM